MAGILGVLDDVPPAVPRGWLVAIREAVLDPHSRRCDPRATESPVTCVATARPGPEAAAVGTGRTSKRRSFPSVFGSACSEGCRRFMIAAAQAHHYRRRGRMTGLSALWLPI